MAKTYTENYNLEKHDTNEFYDILMHAANMEKAEAALTDLSSAITAGGTGTVITLTVPSIVTYRIGLKLTFIALASNGGAWTTINVNGLGAKNLYKPGTTSAPSLTAGKAYDIWSDGTSFFLKASAEGDAVVANVLAGKSFSNDADTGLTGTMVDRGSVGTINLVSEAQEYTISQGYHNGLGKVKAVIAGLIASVIKAGTTVGGILGTFTSDATAIAGHILAPYTAYVNGNKLTGTMVNRAGTNASLANSAVATTITVRPPAGYYDGVDDVVTAVDADFIAANFLANKNLYGLQGSLPVRNNTDTGGSYPDASGQSFYEGMAYLMPSYGFYDGTVWSKSPVPNLLASNLKAGITIGSIVGTLQPRLFAEGVINSNSVQENYNKADGTTGGRYSVIVSGLTFTPKLIYILQNSTSWYLDFFTVYTGDYAQKTDMPTAKINCSANIFKLDGPAYVNATGFKLPTLSSNTSHKWIAFG